ncbi:MAG: hypothetical protein Terrestrivirus6_2 [Terrestrivirus sp.]|uniref:Uncharacterized protein n=1 Tax=Terrestrivirus sp. TaxID=2487775 RepID=A0A3G4ZNC3_9VIRU|nr:MAG: hypothetical protein Terrestrivirus6_2 [Terrestrivirus sp.]
MATTTRNTPKYDANDRFHQIFVVDDGKYCDEFSIKHSILSFLYKTFPEISSISIDDQQKKIRITIKSAEDSTEVTVLSALDDYVLRTQQRKDVFVSDLFFIFQSTNDVDSSYELCGNNMDD